MTDRNRPDASASTSRTIETGAGDLPMPDSIQTRGHRPKYGPQALAPGQSGRRARLRKPARGGVRH